MKKDLKLLIEKFGHRWTEMKGAQEDFEKLSKRLLSYGINLEVRSLKRLWNVLEKPMKRHKPSLDRLALFAGFQSWSDLQQALHGTSDAQLTYEDEPEKKLH